MKTAVVFKGGGYLISTISVLLLGLVSWDGAKGHALLVTALIAGMATSILGMAVRFVAFLRGQKDKDDNSRRLDRLEAMQPPSRERSAR